ncbi:shikimate kinase [Bacillus sp. KH172YL63]|uniref:shikimate kinase n=1 Tax=Bacillus sp. KH172YL63 TaxID=2709784 RepID=UPI0013E49566|nr:shikimate kinase [Bacillus sp. KH172YL63]BCB04714.1 shikimate kinase [Bacillus sp. KH172YL63]
MEPLYFIGFMGVGKTTIGKRLGEVLNLPVVDMDSYIEENEGTTIKEIFNHHGESYFRDLESEALMKLSGTPAIITTGGGVVEREENRQLLRGKHQVFHLTCPFDVLWSRLEGDENRPLVQKNSKERLSSLYNRRLPLYESCNGFDIETKDQTVEEVVQSILHNLKGRAE